MLGTVRCIRQGVAVFEVKDVHADFTRLVFDWCDDLAAHELGAYTEITRRKKDKQEGEQSYWISCYTKIVNQKHHVFMYPFNFDSHIITVYSKYTTIDQSQLNSIRPETRWKIHFHVKHIMYDVRREKMDMMIESWSVIVDLLSCFVTDSSMFIRKANNRIPCKPYLDCNLQLERKLSTRVSSNLHEEHFQVSSSQKCQPNEKHSISKLKSTQ